MAQGLTPTISVVMAVYSGARYLREAIDSILAQTYRDFELIIVDDGSTDESLSIIQSYKDKRITLIKASHQGLVPALNKGIAAAHGEFIARHDGDDASEPERFETQINYLQRHPETVIIGSSMRVMDDKSHILHTHAVLLNDPELRQELLVRSPFAHGSVMAKRQAIIDAGGYIQDEWPSEDYGLWLRMASHGTLANVDRPLYIYREHQEGISAQNQQAQQAKKTQIQGAAWQLRRQLLPHQIVTSPYLLLDMGQFRIERITHNVLFILKGALHSVDMQTIFATMRILMNDRQLRRKVVRFILIRMGIKHD